jgi:hypothetical protein
MRAHAKVGPGAVPRPAFTTSGVPVRGEATIAGTARSDLIFKAGLRYGWNQVLAKCRADTAPGTDLMITNGLDQNGLAKRR